MPAACEDELLAVPVEAMVVEAAGRAAVRVVLLVDRLRFDHVAAAFEHEADLVRLQVTECEAPLRADASEDETRAAALSDERVRAWTEGKQIAKTVIVRGRVVNVVVR